ncbi:MAG: YbaB/EbfC family nucleoid-associated protein [Chloroflexota bacterium]
MKFDIGSIMEQVKKMQGEFERVKQEGEQIKVTGESGGGMVSVTMNGLRQTLSINISDELLAQGDKKMLEDLIVAAINKAAEAAQAKMNEQMGALASMMPNMPNIPGFNPF